jgi:hypothetical protein
MKPTLLLILLAGSLLLPSKASAAPRYSIVPNPTNNTVTVSYTNAFFTGTCTVDGRVDGQWVPLKSFFTTERIGQTTLTLPPNSASEYRLRCLSVAPGNAFVNLARSYGVITTVAGNGLGTGANNWIPSYEGAVATEVSLSNPTFAMADHAGNIFIADRGSHSVLKVTPDGRIRTVAGTHQPGFPTEFGLPIEGPLPGTTSPFHSPTTLHVISNRVFILDSGNSRVRVLDQFGNVSTVVQDPQLATNLAGLWVQLAPPSDELDEIFYGAGTELKRYTVNDGVVTYANGFLNLGNVVINPLGQVIVTDVARHRVYRARNVLGAPQEVVAGTGFTRGNGIGEATTIALPGPRAIWYLPLGGYFVGLDEPSLRQGARIWYVDSEDNAAPFVFGRPGAHAGDGAWFQKGRTVPKISTVKSVTIAPSGDIIIVEGNGFVRKIEFLRIRP